MNISLYRTSRISRGEGLSRLNPVDYKQILGVSGCKTMQIRTNLVCWTRRPNLALLRGLMDSGRACRAPPEACTSKSFEFLPMACGTLRARCRRR